MRGRFKSENGTQILICYVFSQKEDLGNVLTWDIANSETKNGLSGLELSSDTFKKMSVSELRKFTLNYYNENLKGKKTEIKTL